MTRIRYRWVLPVVALALYVSLIWFGCPYVRWARERAQTLARERAEGSIAFDPSCIDFVMPTSEQLADGLNAPAMIAAGLLVLVPLDSRLHLECRDAEYFGHAAVGLFVPFLWFFVGRFIDHRRIPRARRRSPKLRRLLAYSGIVILSLVAVFVFISFFRTGGEPLVLDLCLLGWLGFGFSALLPITRRGQETLTTVVAPLS